MAKIIKGYLTQTNFSRTENFAARSAGYDAARSSQAAASADASYRAAIAKANIAKNMENAAIPGLIASYNSGDLNARIQSERNKQFKTGLGYGLGGAAALAAASALGYGAYKLANKRTELLADGYYAFDQEITKSACRNLNQPGRSRAELRNMYPNARIIKGNTAYQLNPQDFKVAANFSQENFAEPESKYTIPGVPTIEEAKANQEVRNAEVEKKYPKIGIFKGGAYNQANAVESLKNLPGSEREADSLATYNRHIKGAESYNQGAQILQNTIGNGGMFEEQANAERERAERETNEEMNRVYGRTPMEGVSKYNKRVEKLKAGKLSAVEKDALERQAKALASYGNAQVRSSEGKATNPRARENARKALSGIGTKKSTGFGY